MQADTFTAFDYRMMSRALQLAARGLYTTHPNPRVGCVIVQGEEIVGEGWHQVAGQGHAEVNALRVAGNAALGATVYVTLEPCAHHGRTPPCADTLVNAGVGRVIGAMQDPNPRVSGGGFGRLRAAGIEVKSGLLEAQAETLNPGFLKRMRNGLPWVRIKSGISQDARTAMASGESQWITSASARVDVQRWRARSEAIITGVETVLADDPSMTVRLDAWPADEVTPWGWPDGFEPMQPLRVVLDTHLRTPPTAKLLCERGDTLIVHCDNHPAREAALVAAGAKLLKMPLENGRIALRPLLEWLAQQEINEVLVEAGAIVAGAFLQSGLADEWVVYQAPCLLGSEARPALQMMGMSSMADKLSLQLMDVRQIGPDLRLIYRV